jgi:endonuclease/exonuclease/phosphatase family metal-dependent hydrolase
MGGVAPSAVHVMSLNVCGGPRLPGTGPARLAPLRVRARAIGHLVEGSDLDVLALQEVWTGRALATLRSYLPSYAHAAWQRGLWGQPAGGLAILSRLPLGWRRYRSYRGVRPGGSIGFRLSSALNTGLQGVLVVEVPGVGIVADTHLSANRGGDWSTGNRYEALQRGQLRLLWRAVGAPAGLTIVAGDFNIAADSPLYPAIVSSGAWRDPFAGMQLATYQSELLPAGAAPHRIDYILVGGDPADHPILHSGLMLTEPLPEVGYASDHIAVTIKVGH